MKKRSTLVGVMGAVIALVLPLLSHTSASADVLIISDVSAAVTAPASATGAFSAVGTITNSGNINQPAGSRLTFTPASGAVTAAPVGCSIAGGAASCTVGALSAGRSASFAFTVTPKAGVASVTSRVDVAAAIFEQNVLDPTNNTASAVTTIPYAVDASITNRPSDVRYGEDTLLSSTVTNTGAPQTVNVSLATGSTLDTRVALPAGCSGAGGTLSCSFSLGAGASKTFDTAVTAPTSGTSFTSTLTATGASGGTKSASVVTTTSAHSQAFVPAGDDLAYAGSNQNTDFNVPAGSAPGAFVQLDEKTLNNVPCGSSHYCVTQAAEALFDNSGTYSGSDPNHPFAWKITYNVKQSCNANYDHDADDCQNTIYWIPSGQTAAQPMATCSTYGGTQAKLVNVDTPCLQNLTKATNGYVTYTVALLRDIVIPIIGGVSSGVR
ncbi:MAG TPA: hypothetical protein VHD87_17900 [Acidimicrobiales bacterium]|nr:hypothetical protein [Acidimicrobiales bacterium]